MTIGKIKLNSWVLTSMGHGQVVRVGGTHPPSVRVRIVGPLPRGEVMLKPRDVERELHADEIATLGIGSY